MNCLQVHLRETLAKEIRCLSWGISGVPSSGGPKSAGATFQRGTCAFPQSWSPGCLRAHTGGRHTGTSRRTVNAHSRSASNTCCCVHAAHRIHAPNARAAARVLPTRAAGTLASCTAGVLSTRAARVLPTCTAGTLACRAAGVLSTRAARALTRCSCRSGAGRSRAERPRIDHFSATAARSLPKAEHQHPIHSLHQQTLAMARRAQ